MLLLLFNKVIQQFFCQKSVNNSYLSGSKVGWCQTVFYTLVRNADEGERFSKIIVSSDEELNLFSGPRSNGKAALCPQSHAFVKWELVVCFHNSRRDGLTNEVKPLAYVGIQEKAERL